MKIYDCGDQNQSLRRAFITGIKKIFIGKKIYHCDENRLLKVEFLWKRKPWMKMKFYNEDNNFQCDENFSTWWKYKPTMQIYHCDEISSLRYKAITVMNVYYLDGKVFYNEIYPCYENLSLRWKVI